MDCQVLEFFLDKEHFHQREWGR